MSYGCISNILPFPLFGISFTIFITPATKKMKFMPHRRPWVFEETLHVMRPFGAFFHVRVRLIPQLLFRASRGLARTWIVEDEIDLSNASVHIRPIYSEKIWND
jgi:hypothetical protein